MTENYLSEFEGKSYVSLDYHKKKLNDIKDRWWKDRIKLDNELLEQAKQYEKRIKNGSGRIGAIQKAYLQEQDRNALKIEINRLEIKKLHFWTTFNMITILIVFILFVIKTW